VVDSKNVLKVAHLARLEISEAEEKIFTAQLGHIFSYVEQLQEVDVTGVEPLTHPLELSTPMREDVVIPSPVNADHQPRVLESAPDTMLDGFKVPPIL
jgi:aspartyl-tRNA(Asn)/glutamyl-tRNA(Gln) amidotransferase subunit C